MNHYVYYSFEDWGRGYIGVRQCECDIVEDLYFGSYYDKTFNPTNKIVLIECESRKEALASEVVLHKFYNVKSNPHFANQSNQTSNKSWVSDINKSEADIKRKEKVSKIFKYSTFIVGCTMLIFVLFLLGKSKLKIINPIIISISIQIKSPISFSSF